MLIHKFLLAIFWGPRANEMRDRGPRGLGLRAEDKGQWPRVEEHKHPTF